MDFVLVFLINTAFFAFAFILLARRFHRLYNTKAFLDTVETETHRIMTAFNQSAEDNIRILEDRIETLERLKVETNELVRRLDEVRLNPSVGPYIPKIAELPKAVVSEQAEALVEKQAQPTPITKPTVNPEPQLPNARDMVILLARQGLAPELIAYRTGIPMGEVDLIINFHGKG